MLLLGAGVLFLFLALFRVDPFENVEYEVFVARRAELLWPIAATFLQADRQEFGFERIDAAAIGLAVSPSSRCARRH